MNEKKNEALRKYQNALSRLTEASDELPLTLQADAVIQRFELTFELLWKTLKIYLEDLGIETKSPKETLKTPFKQGWIANETLILDMLEDRNRASHIYDESYLDVFQTILIPLQTK